jgi:hypothetical protein
MLKFIAIILCIGIKAATIAGIIIPVNGNFIPSKKAGAPPTGWRLTSGSKGTLEVVPNENGNNIILNAAPKGSIGIYSAKIKAKAGDKIKVSAKVIGEKITFAIFQYGKKTTAQRQELKSAPEGMLISHVFSVTDSSKGATDFVRVAFVVYKGKSAAVSNVKVELEAGK